MRRDWLLLVAVLVVALVAWATVARIGSSGEVRASAAAVSHPARAAGPVPSSAPARPAGHVDEESVALSAPYSWDYRWLAGHPATGAPANRSISMILVDVDTHHVLDSRNPHRRMAPASTTKLVTAMVAIDAASPDTVVTIPAEATMVEPDHMGLGAGEKLSVHDLLYGLLLDSGNDAAEALAMTLLGRDAFVAAMNAKAASLGMMDTHFVNPSGLDNPLQYSSAHDLAVAAAYLYTHYPLLAQVVHTKQYAIIGNSDHKWYGPYNYDKLLWTYPGAIGFKTGLTDNAGNCLVSGATRGGHTVVAVELNDPLIFTEAAPLLDYGFRRAG